MQSMKSMKNILVPTDFSEAADAALKLASQLAQNINGRIILLNVIDPPEGSDFTAQGASNNPVSFEDIFTFKLIEKIRNDLEEAASDYEDVEIETEFALGDIVKKVNQKVKDDDVDLVIMGTTGSSGLQEFLVGSNTEKVVRYAHCPVLSVKAEQHELPGRHMVFASTFTESLDHIVPHLKAFQQLFKATIHLLSVNTPRNFVITGEARKRMREFAEAFQLENYTLNIYNHKDEEDGITSFAEENDMDVISVATHGRTGLAHLLSGSVSEGLVNHCTKPVLTLNLNNLK